MTATQTWAVMVLGIGLLAGCSKDPEAYPGEEIQEPILEFRVQDVVGTYHGTYSYSHHSEGPPPDGGPWYHCDTKIIQVIADTSYADHSHYFRAGPQHELFQLYPNGTLGYIPWYSDWPYSFSGAFIRTGDTLHLEWVHHFDPMVNQYEISSSFSGNRQ